MPRRYSLSISGKKRAPMSLLVVTTSCNFHEPRKAPPTRPHRAWGQCEAHSDLPASLPPGLQCNPEDMLTKAPRLCVGVIYSLVTSIMGTAANLVGVHEKVAAFFWIESNRCARFWVWGTGCPSPLWEETEEKTWHWHWHKYSTQWTLFLNYAHILLLKTLWVGLKREIKIWQQAETTVYLCFRKIWQLMFSKSTLNNP